MWVSRRQAQNAADAAALAGAVSLAFDSGTDFDRARLMAKRVGEANKVFGRDAEHHARAPAAAGSAPTTSASCRQRSRTSARPDSPPSGDTCIRVNVYRNGRQQSAAGVLRPAVRTDAARRAGDGHRGDHGRQRDQLHASVRPHGQMGSGDRHRKGDVERFGRARPVWEGWQLGSRLLGAPAGAQPKRPDGNAGVRRRPPRYYQAPRLRWQGPAIVCTRQTARVSAVITVCGCTSTSAIRPIRLITEAAISRWLVREHSVWKTITATCEGVMRTIGAERKRFPRGLGRPDTYSGRNRDARRTGSHGRVASPRLGRVCGWLRVQHGNRPCKFESRGSSPYRSSIQQGSRTPRGRCRCQYGISSASSWRVSILLTATAPPSRSSAGWFQRPE